MALVNKPDESIFASSAKQGEVDNFPDLLRGWGITFEQTQGIPPMEWFNFLFKRLDEKHAYLMQRGLPEWSATQDYTKGSCVQFDGLSYRALKVGKNNKPNESDSQYWVRWGFALTEIAHATLTQYGLTQLYTGYDSQREDLALTPKTAYQLKQLINSNTRSLGNFIPNSKKSSRVDSNSAEDVATSVAVKTAYDKGVEAKDAADNANQNAEGRVSKSGDTMTGNLSLKQGDYSGLNLYNNDGYYTRLEGNPHNANSLLTLVYRTPQGTNIAVVNLPKKNGTIAYADDVVFKSGGAMTGILYSIGISSKHYGYGNYANQYTSGAPFMVETTGSQDRDTYHPFVKGLVRSKGRFGAGFSFGYTTKQGAGDGFGRGIIHLIEDNGANRTWAFEHNGDFVSPNDVLSSSGRSINKSIQHDELVGEVAFFARSTPPSGWLKANGAAVSRTTYAELFAAIGTTFGAGDGRTTFNLPDLRGEFLRCLDDGRNIDRGRRLGTAQGDAIRNITGKLDGSAMGSGNQVLEGKMIASGAIGTTYQQRQWSGDQGGWGEQSVSFDFDASRVVPVANENRPRNVALLACIKY